MKRIQKIISNVVKTGNIPFPVCAVAFCIMAAVIFGYAYKTGAAALIILAMFLISGLPQRTLPTPIEIANEMARFLEELSNRETNLSVLKDILYDELPVSGGTEKQRFLRWEYGIAEKSGLTIINIGVIRTSAIMISSEILKAETTAVQNVLISDIRRGNISLPVFASAKDGYPALYLLSITDKKEYRVFSFALVCNAEQEAKAICFGAPPIVDDTKDKDF